MLLNTEAHCGETHECKHGDADIQARHLPAEYEDDACKSPMQIYLEQINDTPLLTPEEERELACAISAGDEACLKLADMMDAQPQRFGELPSPAGDGLRTTDRAECAGMLRGWKKARMHLILTATTAKTERVEELRRTLNATEAALEDVSKYAREQGDGEALHLLSNIERAMAARDHLTRANLRLVVNIARSYMERGLHLSDLIEEGNTGLMRAVESFDADRNIRFGTYAGYWIKRIIWRAISNQAKTVRVPAYVLALVGKYRRASEATGMERGHSTRFQEVADAMGLGRRKRQGLLRALSILNHRIFDGRGNAGGNVVALEEQCEDSSAQDALTTLIQQEDLQVMHEALLALERSDPRLARILHLRYWGNGESPSTLAEVGKEMQLTKERVRQLETQAVERLAHTMGGIAPKKTE